MKLNTVLEGVEIREVIGETQREIEGIAYHSGHVKPGFLFVALRGQEVDGHLFIPDALDHGAETVVVERMEGLSESHRATFVRVDNSRQALAQMATNFYSHPSSKMTLIGVTGTNGKTTTTFLLESILKKAGFRVGVVGTINTRYGETVIQAVNTTPESLDLQRMFSEMAENGVSHVIMEVSSHGLDLDRVLGCQFDLAVFTNFASDHLDYHQTLEHYFQSKRKLFSHYLATSPKPKRFAITNGDDPKGEIIARGCNVPVVRYGLKSPGEVSAHLIESTFEGLRCRIRTPQGEFDVHSELIGGYNLYNILAAVSGGVAMNLPNPVLKEGIEAVKRVAGRFDKVENQKGINVIVDYAHKKDALEQVLLGLRSVLSDAFRGSSAIGKVITVFGCGGDRDRTKRPLMGEVAGKYSDLCILTSDNPRTEDPVAIMEEVEKGLRTLNLKKWRPDEISLWRSAKGYLSIADRREAIRTAIRLAQPSDTVLIAGKGHENYQILGKKKFPFDDRVEARKALEEA